MFNSKEADIFTKFLHSCAEQRLKRLSNVLIKDEKYQTLCDEKLKILQQIIFALPDDPKHNFIKYIDKDSEILETVQTIFYKHGFRDAVMFILTLFAGFNMQELTDLLGNMSQQSV